MTTGPQHPKYAEYANKYAKITQINMQRIFKMRQCSTFKRRISTKGSSNMTAKAGKHPKRDPAQA